MIMSNYSRLDDTWNCGTVELPELPKHYLLMYKSHLPCSEFSSILYCHSTYYSYPYPYTLYPPNSVEKEATVTEPRVSTSTSLTY